jgi:pyruvate/2-oxoglutarate dehydrogenase complex dihydrolipoamide dehydrogenase (E3) component
LVVGGGRPDILGDHAAHWSGSGYGGKGKGGRHLLHAGCIPAMALLHVANFIAGQRKNAVEGVRVLRAGLDWPAAQVYKEQFDLSLPAE